MLLSKKKKKKKPRLKFNPGLALIGLRTNWAQEVTLGYIFKKIQFVANYRHTKVFGGIF